MIERRRIRELLRAILEETVPNGNGGYVAEFGPVTYARLMEFANDTEKVEP